MLNSIQLVPQGTPWSLMRSATETAQATYQGCCFSPSVWEKHVSELPVSLVSWCTRSPLTILLLNILLSGIRPHVQTFSLGNMASVCHYSQAIQISSPHKAPFCNTDHRPWLQPGEWSGSKQMFLCLRLLIFLFGSIFLFCLLFKHYKKFKRKNSETWGMKIYYS